MPVQEARGLPRPAPTSGHRLRTLERAEVPPQGSLVSPSLGSAGRAGTQENQPPPPAPPGRHVGTSSRPVLGRTSCAEPMLTPPRGQSPGRGGQHGLPSVHRRGRDWSSRHDVGPAGHCSGDPSRGTLPIPQGAQRVGKVGAGGGTRGAGGGDGGGHTVPGSGLAGGLGEDLGLAAVHLRVKGVPGGQVTRHIPKAAPNTQRAAGKPCNDRQGQRARNTGWAAQAQDRGSGRNPQAQSLHPHPPTHPGLNMAVGSWGHSSPLACAPPHRPVTVRPCGHSFV